MQLFTVLWISGFYPFLFIYLFKNSAYISCISVKIPNNNVFELMRKFRKTPTSWTGKTCLDHNMCFRHRSKVFLSPPFCPSVYSTGKFIIVTGTAHFDPDSEWNILVTVMQAVQIFLFHGKILEQLKMFLKDHGN